MPIDQPKTAAESIDSVDSVIPSITTNVQLADDTGSLGSTAFHVDQKHKYPYVVITGVLDLERDYFGKSMSKAAGATLVMGAFGFGLEYDCGDVVSFRGDTCHGVAQVKRSHGEERRDETPEIAQTLPCARSSIMLMSQKPSNQSSPRTMLE